MAGLPFFMSMKAARVNIMFATLAAALVVAQGSVAQAQARAMRMGPRLQWLLQQQQQQDRSGPVDPTAPPPPEVDGLGPWLKRFHESVPQTASEFGAVDMNALNQASD